MGDGHHHAGESEQIFYDLTAGVGVEAGGDLVGDDEVVPAKCQPCDADALALPAREILAVLADEGVEAVGQGAHPVGEARRPDGVGKLTCRLGTMVLDAAIMIVGGNLLAAQGAALMDGLIGHFIPSGVSYTGAAASAAASAAGVVIIGGADGPTAIFVSYNAQELWGLCVKVFSNVVVVVLNYVFSKLIIFKKK